MSEWSVDASFAALLFGPLDAPPFEPFGASPVESVGPPPFDPPPFEPFDASPLEPFGLSPFDPLPFESVWPC